MSEFDQVPFDAVTDFASNPENRCPCLLLLDNSGSMRGNPIDELNAGLLQFKDELAADPMASKRVEVAIVSFGPVRTVSDFITADLFQPPTLVPEGDTPMGSAIEQGLSLLEDRKRLYRENGISFYRPWVFLITDGGPTDSFQRAAQLVREGEAAKKFEFFAVAVQGANFEVLKQISVKAPLSLKEMRFRDLFKWLSNSLSAVSRSQPGEGVTLESPVTPTGWASVGS